MKRILLVGGGTGGHFYPLIAVAQHVRLHKEISDAVELYYMGPEPYDQQALDENGIHYVWCLAGKRRRYFSMRNYVDLLKSWSGLFVAIWKLYVIYPDVVFSKGGYTSVPVTVAAWLLRIPVVVHESDSRPGTANKIAARFARYIAISFPEVADYLPDKQLARTGIPIRTEFTVEHPNPREILGLPPDKPLLFVTGGSQGAERLNTLVLESLDELLPHFIILHQTGAANEPTVRDLAISLITDETLLSHYYVKGNLTAGEMHAALSAATIVVSRAGATSIYEIAHQGTPSIVVPIPEAISHDQRPNAYAYARTGAAHVLEEANLTDGLLTAEILNILNNKELYKEMSVAAKTFAQGDAAEQIVQILIKIANEHA